MTIIVGVFAHQGNDDPIFMYVLRDNSPRTETLDEQIQRPGTQNQARPPRAHTTRIGARYGKLSTPNKQH